MAGLGRVFISYSNKDAVIVTRLKDDLKRAGVEVWLDHEQLTPGTQNWQAAVRRGIEQATTVIYSASPDAADSEYVGHELAIARDEGKIILPFWIRGEKWSRCTPMGYYYAQHVDGRDAAYAVGLAALLAALGSATSAGATPSSAAGASVSGATVTSSTGMTYATPDGQLFYPLITGPRTPAISPERFPARLATLGYEAHARDGVEWIVPPLCAVPAGPFRLGSDRRRDKEAHDDELQRREVTLAAYDLARFPVTVAEYACFVNATKRTPPQKGVFNSLTWDDQLQRLDHPVIAVTWADSYDYAAWLAQRTGQPWRLPTEAEWEKAARCDPRDPLGASSERIYPWGDTFDAARCNTHESKVGATSPVGWYGPNDPDPRSGRRSGASPCGAEDLAGNVWEWTASAYTPGYSKSELSVQRDSTTSRVLRGGSWFSDSSDARAAYRNGVGWGGFNVFGGFRLARAALAHST